MRLNRLAVKVHLPALWVALGIVVLGGPFSAYAQTPIACGQTLAGNIASPAQRDSYTFSGNAGEAVIITAVGLASPLCTYAELYNSSGTRLTFNNCNGTTGSFALPATGTYTISIFDAGLNDTGNYEVNLQFTTGRCGTGISCAQTRTGTLANRTQHDVYTFSGNAGEAVIVTAVGLAAPLCSYVELYNPSGTRLTYNNCNGTTGSFALPATGAYTLMVYDAGFDNLGNYELNLQFTTGRCGTGISCAQTRTGTLANRTQHDVYTFSGNAGEAVIVTAVGLAAPLCSYVELYNPSGTRLTYNNCNGTTGSFALPATGAYTLMVYDAGFDNLGNYELNLQFTTGRCGTGISCAQTRTGTLANRTQHDMYTFSGNAGEAVIVTAVGLAAPLCSYVELYNPSGTRLTYNNCNGTTGSFALPATGAYTLMVYDAGFDNLGNYELNLQFTTGRCGTGISCAQTRTGTLANRTQHDVYTFSGNAGEAVIVTAVGLAAPLCSYVELYNPSGTRLTYNNCNGTTGSFALPATGAYTLMVYDAGFDNLGNYELNLQFTTGRCGTGISCAQTRTGTLSNRTQHDVYTFSGNAGEAVIVTAVGLAAPLCSYVELYNPSGTRLTYNNCNGTTGSFALPATGAYTLMVYDAGFDNLGNYELNLQFTTGRCGTGISCAQTRTGTLANRTQHDVYTFSGNAGEAVIVTAVGLAAPLCSYVELYNPSGTRLTYNNCNGTTGSFALPATGAYTLMVYDAGFDNLGDYSLNLICQGQSGLTLTSLNPSSVAENEPSFALTVTGAGFASGVVVQWNSSPRSTTYVSGTQLQARILTADVFSSGTAQVTVVQAGVSSNALTFTITVDNAPPVITQVLPPTGPTLGNTKCIILGDHFKPGLGTTPVINPISESTVIEVAAGELNGVQAFQMEAESSLPVAASDTVLHRNSLGGVVRTSHEGVFFGGVRVGQVVFVNRTQLEVTTPPNPSGSTEVQVVQSNGTAGLPNAYTYKTLPPVPTLQLPKRRYQIPFVVDNLAFRTNLGINNLGSTPAAVDLLLAENNGLLVTQKSVTVPAHGMRQINNVIRELEEASGLTGREGYLILDSAESIGAWASQIDNVSLDPSLENSGQETGATNRILLPSSVSSGRFLTSLIVINTSAKAGTVAIRVRDGAGNLRLLVSSQPIAARGYFYFGDFYRAAGLSDVFGPIEVEGSEGLQLLATERIFTQENTSAYFEGVDLARAAKTLVLPYAVDTTDFRTNLGINNPGTTPANVMVSLVAKDGLVKGSLTETVAPNGLKQINDINRQLLGKGEVTGEEGTLRLESDQPIVAWTSQIDNLTQDPSLVVGKPSTATKLLIPSTTSAGNFKSTLAVVNLSSTPTSVQITARDNEGNIQATRSVTVPPQGLLSETDIRSSLNLAGTFGPLEIVSQDNKPLLAVSRVYSNQRTGGYFEGIGME